MHSAAVEGDAPRLVEHPSAGIGHARKQFREQVEALKAGQWSAIALIGAAAQIYFDELRKAYVDEREYLIAAQEALDEWAGANLVLADKFPELERARVRRQLLGPR